jgi:hypothetical protein
MEVGEQSMNDREEIRLRLRNEYAQLDRCIEELQASVDSAKGAVRLYREQRLKKAMQDRERLNQRLRLLNRADASKRWSEAEKLWSDLRNTVLGMGALGAR